ncbi:MAG: apolipoprotein N-acyltransferase [Caulobacteraceae bacterium]
MAERGSPRRAWATRAAAILAGAAVAFAQPPWGFLPGLLGYAAMLWLVDRSPNPSPLRSAFWRGWLAGVGYFVVSVWWIAEPFQIDAKEQGWMAPLAVASVSMFMALFWGAAATAYRALRGGSAVRVLVFAATFCVAEWLRGHMLTGFPWDLAGETWRAGSALSQAAALVGVYGLSWITVATFATPAVVCEGWPGRAAVLLAALVVAGLYAFGSLRLAGAPRADPAAPQVRVVQADVRQEVKYDPRLFADIVGRYVRLTARPSARRPDIVVWPEGAIPVALEEYLAPGAWTYVAIAGALAPGQTLILGGYRFGEDRAGRPATYNSLAVVRRLGAGLAVVGIYDKYRLVPFGEFMPLDGLAARLGIKQLVHVGDGFAAGPRPRPLRLPGLPTVQPLICYEALYSGFTREGARLAGQRAAWIVNISNDAWFGTASGPRQHLNMARYRAIEEGLPMVRATPTGISAFIDAFGRLVTGEALGEGAFGVIDALLPPALEPTPFDRWGDGAFWLMLIVSLAGARWRGRQVDG